MARINTTGQLRAFLCKTIGDVADGVIQTEAAKEIVNLSKQVNESYYAEVKVAQLNRDLEEQVVELGSLPIE